MSSLTTNGKWVCEKCQKEQESNRIEEIVRKAKDDILNNGKTFGSMELFRSLF